MEKKYFLGLDVVKVLAIAWICLFHIFNYRTDWAIGVLSGSEHISYFFNGTEGFWASFLKSFISFGSLGVNLFIIASGVGLTLSRNHDRTKFFQFIKKRLLRIFPLYWAILAFYLLIEIIKNHPINYIDYAVHFLAIQNFFPQYLLSIAAPFWFISTIIQLYILFPFLYALSKRHWVVPIILAILFKIFVAPQLIAFFGGGRFFTEYIIDFTVGITLGNILVARPQIFNSKKWLLLIPIFPITFAIWAFVTFNSYEYSNAVFRLTFQLLTMLFCIITFTLSTFFSGKIASFIKLLSTLSFTVFLTHYFLITEIIRRFSFRIPFPLEAVIFVIASFSLAYLINRAIKILLDFTARIIKIASV